MNKPLSIALEKFDFDDFQDVNGWIAEGLCIEFEDTIITSKESLLNLVTDYVEDSKKCCETLFVEAFINHHLKREFNIDKIVDTLWMYLS